MGAMWKSLSLLFAVWIYAIAFPQGTDNRADIDDRIRDILLASSKDRSKMPDVQLAKNLSNSDLVSLVNKIIHSLSQNGTLTNEGKLKLKDLIGHYVEQHAKNFTIDGKKADNATVSDAVQSFLKTINLKDGDFDYTVVRSLHNEIDIEEEEEETDDPEAKDQIVVDYIKNIDKTLAVEGEVPDSEPNDKQLKKLFNIMAPQ